MKVWIRSILGAVISVGVIAAPASCRKASTVTQPVPGVSAATAPVVAATAPAAASRPTTAPVVADYLALIHADFPQLQGKELLPQPINLSQAAHLVVHERLCLSGAPRMDLWIDRPDAPPLGDVFREAMDPNADPEAHLLKEQVVFVHWMPSETGPWLPYLVCRRGSNYEIAWPNGRRAFSSPRRFLWRSAFSWNQYVVAPSEGGVSVLDLSANEIEQFQNLVDNAAATAPAGVSTTASTTAPAAEIDRLSLPQALLDMQGLLAWVPYRGAGSSGGRVWRYVEGKWSDLTADAGWPAKMVYVVPLLDGSALQLVGGEHGEANLKAGIIGHVAVDEAKIAALVDQLADLEEAKRTDAYQQLTRYGPGVWPILEKLAPDQPPEAQASIEQLLKDKARPTLAGMSLIGKKGMTLVDRLPDGGAVFYCEQGVRLPGAMGKKGETKAPAWLSLRPGRPVELLGDALTTDLKPNGARFWAIGNEWVVRSDIQGPRRFIGNGFMNLLRKDERQFDELVGIDHRGRWVFQKGGDGAELAGTLLIDPNLPDPTPRLPGWEITAAKTAGWDKHDWPAIEHGSAYALTENDWQLLDKQNPLIQTVPPAAPIAATTQPTSAPAVLPILVRNDGVAFYDGQSTLRAVDPKGRETVWPLPAIATGSGEVHLVQTKDGTLFLFNQPGRVLRIRPTPGGTEPFKVEATFTRHVPNADKLTRVWLDPAGRIAIVWDNKLTLLFPKGYIPQSIVEKMLTKEEDEGE